MKIVIPMSGRGNRFVEAGYKVPKPLIEIDGKPIIEHVVNMFPGEQDFLFICSSDHLETTNMRIILERIAPQGKIIAIEPHKKGPVYAVSQVFNEIKDDEEIIVNYCDFSCYWDYNDFLTHTRSRNADGAIPSYKGFHPHMLGSTNYAFIKEQKQWLEKIKEKEPFTDIRMQEYASSGTYYFKEGAIVKKYFTELIEKDINLKGEYYVSLVYNLLYEAGLKTSVYEIQHMLQWGTPQDVKEYSKWSEYFAQVVREEASIPIINSNTTNMIPLAGAGSRFKHEGYKEPKPLINVSGKPMLIQASECLPVSDKQIFICLNEHLESYELSKNIYDRYQSAKIIPIEQLTEGQAQTCMLASQYLNEEEPLLISACDNGVLWDFEKYYELLKDNTVDVIIWGFKNHVSSERNPEMYGWIKIDENDNVKAVSVKKPISDNPFNDHAIVGTFYFKKAKYFLESCRRLFDKNIRVNGEFYVDSAINELIEIGLNAKVFEVSQYVCWGTPSDLKTFEYWQSFFHKCDWHPYKMENDIYFKKSEVLKYEIKYKYFKQEYI